MRLRAECVICRQKFEGEQFTLTRLFAGDKMLVVYLCPAHKVAALPYINRQYFQVNAWSMTPDTVPGSGQSNGG